MKIQSDLIGNYKKYRIKSLYDNINGCSIKTQMLNDRLEDRNRELAVAQNALNNAQQTQNILGATGRWVGWAGSGTQTAGVVSAS